MIPSFYFFLKFLGYGLTSNFLIARIGKFKRKKNRRMKTQQEIIEKIQKLLALSKSPNEHEAILAANKAQELLLQYNLKYDDFDENKEKTTEKVFDQYKQRVIWKGELAKEIAVNNFCDFWYDKRYYPVTYGYVFVGKPHNIEVCQWLYDYLTETIQRLADEAWEKEASRYTHGKNWKNSFRMGCVHRLREKMEEQLKQNMEQGTTGTATSNGMPGLVVSAIYEKEKQAIELYKKELGLKFKKQQNRYNTNYDGYQAGKDAADSIGLNKTVKSGQYKLKGN